MKFEIIWSNFAESQLDEIFEKASLKVAKKRLTETNRIVDNPEMVQIEDLLIDREEAYRYLIPIGNQHVKLKHF